MAVTPKANPTAAGDQSARRGAEFKGRRLAIGANVALTVVLATAVVVLVQWLAFYRTAKLDLTDTGVNSLTNGTEQLLGGLDQRIRLTSMYFQTDLEEENQKKYRNRIGDLLELYQAANRSKVEIESFNPLQDHAARERFRRRVQDLEKFRKESQEHRELIERYQNEIAGRMADLLQTEMETIESLQAAAPDDPDLGQLHALMDRWREELNFTVLDVEEAISAAQPRYSAAASAISTACSGFAKQLNNITKFGKQQAARRSDVPPDFAAFLSGAEDRYRTLVNLLEEQATQARDLPRLEFENLLRDIGPTSNALVVETETDAKVVAFRDIWPAIDPYIVKPAYKDRLFKGEEKITSAVLQLTQKEKTAVVFVRFGGKALFVGGIFPGQARSAYTQMKSVLEGANFVVREWDLSTANEPPPIDPEPVRTIYVVLRPNQPPLQQQFQRQPGQTFSEQHRQRLLSALGDNPRAIFLAGWAPGPFGAFPAPYEYEAYLSESWGIEPSSDLLLLNAIGIGPGQFRLAPQSLFVTSFSRSPDHILVSGLSGKPASFRLVAPLELAAEPPEGVTVEPLLWCEKGEGLWGAKDIQKYQQKSLDEYLVKEPDDVYGPFTIAAVAEKGDGKVVVIGSRDCMTDQIALADVMMLTSQGFTVRPRNPGNIHLFLNCLHWLNDKVEWMDVGKPVDIGTLQIDEGPTLTMTRWFFHVVWPGMALFCGGVAWWVRRR